MMKVISAIILSLMVGNAAFAQKSMRKMDAWLKFENSFIFHAELIVHDNNADYWVMPIAEDEVGVERARAMIRLMESITHKENPFIVKIRLAAIDYDYSDPILNGDSELAKIATETFKETPRQKMAKIKCLGYYSDVTIPLCSIYLDGKFSMQEIIIEKGLTPLSKNSHEVSNEDYATLLDAQDRAKDGEVGIWYPFYYMKKAMER